MASSNSGNQDGSARLNTIGVERKQLDFMLAGMDDAGAPAGGSVKRKHVRWPFRHTSVSVEITQPGSSTPVRLKMACRNLSSEGMGLLHSAYVHVGSRVIVSLPTPESKERLVPGVVRRCAHFRGLVHEVGIQFNKPLNPKDYIQFDPFGDCFSRENVEPETLAGCVVIIEDSEIDQKLAKHFLRETQLRVRIASTAAEGLKLVCEGCDLLICDWNLPDMSGPDVCRRIRGSGSRLPIIVATAERKDATRENLKALGASAFLAKPLMQPMLLRAIAEFIVPGVVTGGGATSSLPADHPNRAVADAFLALLPDYAGRLKEAMRKKDARGCREVAMQICSPAPTLGFEALGKLADRVANSLSAGVNIADLAAELTALVSACEAPKRGLVA